MSYLAVLVINYISSLDLETNIMSSIGFDMSSNFFDGIRGMKISVSLAAVSV